MEHHADPIEVNSLSIFMLTDGQSNIAGEVTDLSEQGYLVKAFTDTQAIPIETELPDLFILNLLASNVDKFALVKEIRQKSQAVGVLLVLSSDNQDDRVSAFMSGADNYILQPYDIEELLAIVGSMERRYRWR